MNTINIARDINDGYYDPPRNKRVGYEALKEIKERFQADLLDTLPSTNLKSLAVGYTASACCPGSSGLGLTASVKLLVGQEPK